MKWRTWVSVLAVSLWFAAPVAAQSNEILDEILDSDELRYGQVAYVVAFALGEANDDTGVSTAPAAVDQWVRGFSATSDDPVTLGEYSVLLVEGFGFPPGVLYRIAPGPRYATRELVFRGVIQGDAYPNASLTGDRALRILSRVLQLQETESIQ